MTDIAPTIIQDTREQAPLAITKYPVVVDGLPVGDYGIKGFSNWSNPEFIVERKSIDDLVQSLVRGKSRFFTEVKKLRQFRFAAILVEGVEDQIRSGSYRSNASPASVLALIDVCIVRAGIHFIYAGSAQGAAERLEALVRQFSRGVERDFRTLVESSGQTARISLREAG